MKIKTAATCFGTICTYKHQFKLCAGRKLCNTSGYQNRAAIHSCEVDPERANDPCYMQLYASNEVDRQNGDSSKQLTLTWANMSQKNLYI